MSAISLLHRPSLSIQAITGRPWPSSVMARLSPRPCRILATPALRHRPPEQAASTIC
ncbi:MULTISPECIES: hypothetical protein [unclassified Nonomuraea]|uniref:hypothetical protein n=1 Tax=unclassified Nonomuraea TaxID=2593643 RepID=UPI00137758D9|nr:MULTISPECIES: hypothetical protein [unclassified Nonomuraea]NBE96941.1 hypothetical protein [Nonomuraea sp. K271]